MSLLLRWVRSRLWPSLRRARRWRVAALVLTGILLILPLMFRRPLGDWIWPDTRLQQLLRRGDAALAAGRLSAKDGSGARELFAAAMALNSDRNEAQSGLVRTGAVAVAQARAALAAGDLARAQRLLELAKQLQMPLPQVNPLDTRLRQLSARSMGLDTLLAQADAARHAGRLDGTPESALPLYQRVLVLAPERVDALEGREDALGELLAQARAALDHGRLEKAAGLLAAARAYDPGHADLPRSEGQFYRALETRTAHAQWLLRRGSLALAVREFSAVLAAKPDATQARRGLERAASQYAAQATRQAADFQFAAAENALQQARALSPQAAPIAAAAQAVERARQAQRALRPELPPMRREFRLRQLLQRSAAAQTAQQWLTPPGASAYDAVRAAQALAPHDPRVVEAATNITRALRDCFARQLRENRLHATEDCLDAWQTLVPQDGQLPAARRRLAQRWIAVGSERLTAEDAAFAQRALAQAQRLDPATPELSAFAARVGAVSPQGH